MLLNLLWASVQLEFRTLGYGPNSLKCATCLVFQQHAKSYNYDNLLPLSHSYSKLLFSDDLWTILCKDPFSSPIDATFSPWCVGFSPLSKPITFPRAGQVSKDSSLLPQPFANFGVLFFDGSRSHSFTCGYGARSSSVSKRTA